MFRRLGLFIAFAITCTSGALAGFPSPSSTGVPSGWVPKKTYTSELRITTPGTVLEDVRLVNANLLIDAENVTLRRVDIQGGSIVNDPRGTCRNGLVVEDVSIGRGPGQVTTDDDPPALGPGGYTARRVKIDGVPEGFRVSGRSVGCKGVTIEDSFARVVAPDVCKDWHGDAMQGYDGAELTIVNVTLQLVDRPDCGGTAPFFYPPNQGNTSVDVSELLVLGGGFPFRLGMPGVVRGLNVVAGSWAYGPIDVKCSVVKAWNAHIVMIDTNYQLTKVLKSQPCNTTFD